ncbi:MAG: hypothetical protein GF372_13160 [Candidatus Marinimicrobia bacterium]|nr:hypothetical protein [Candidatus Neomarinimicrobiota bacterium]
MDQNRTVAHSDGAPVYTINNQTEFLDNFCREKGVELKSVMGEAFEFTNYYVKYNGSYQHTLLHYHADDEEYIFMDELPAYSNKFMNGKYQ